MRSVILHTINLPRIIQIELAIYLNVSPKTARLFAEKNNFSTLGRLEKKKSYAWIDVWRATGVDNAENAKPEMWKDLMEPLLTAQELSPLLGLKNENGAKRVRERAKEGLIPVIRVTTSTLRFRRSDIFPSPHQGSSDEPNPNI